MTDQTDNELDTGTELPVIDALTSLKQRADLMGVSYHPSIGIDKLREKINAKLNGEPEVADAKPVLAKAEIEEESEGQRRARLKKEANRLVRVNITCMNPLKKEWHGEILTAGNSVVGMFRKFIPFNTTDGYHVPQILLSQLQERQCQVFYNEKSHRGVTVRRGKLIKEFAIEMLTPLTEDELKELGRRQAMEAGQTV